MSNKVKMKCASCHRAFKSSKPTQILCEDCERKRRQEKGSVVASSKPAPTPTTASAKPSWLAQAIVRDETVPYELPVLQEPRPSPSERPEPRHPTPGAAPRKPDHATPIARRPTRTGAPATPRATKAPKEQPKPFEPTPAQIAAIEDRYRALAYPEFDGIRTQIASELEVPKGVVKRIIAALRDREHLPSWWELQNYSGSAEELERIQSAYLAYLPTPPIGVHKQLAQDLQLSATSVYQAIRTIRQALGMPIFNPPEAHSERETATTAS